MNFTEIRFADKEETTWVIQPGTLFVSVDAVGNRHHTDTLEDIANDAVVQPWVGGPTALENWVEEMVRSDTELLPRYAEDILDGMANKLSVPQITLDRLQAKKDKRGEKP